MSSGARWNRSIRRGESRRRRGTPSPSPPRRPTASSTTWCCRTGTGRRAYGGQAASQTSWLGKLLALQEEIAAKENELEIRKTELRPVLKEELEATKNDKEADLPEVPVVEVTQEEVDKTLSPLVDGDEEEEFGDLNDEEVKA